MAIYRRCNKCRRDNQLNLKTCSDCKTKLKDKYLVRIKDSSTGKWITKTCASIQLAKQIETKFKIKIIEGSALDKKKKEQVSFSRYLEFAKQNKKTWADDQKRWNLYVKGYNYKTTHGIMGILSRMKGRGLKPATIHHALKLIKRVYNFHIQIGLADTNPATSIAAPKYDNRVNNILSKKESADLIKYLESWGNRRAALVILFGLYSGRRLGEILKLRWDNINTETNTYTCNEMKNGMNSSFPLNQSLLSVIREAEGLKISELIFPCGSGKYFHSFQSTWSRLKKRKNLSIRFHDLRHTYASHLASSGKISIYTLKILLGHKDISLTERYSHLLDEHLQEASSVVDDIFG